MADTFDAYHKWLGIPPEEQPPNHYRLLGIRPFEDDPEVIEASADQRMIHLRTFQAGKHADWAERLLNEVSTARLCLLNPPARAAYDAKLSDQDPAQHIADPARAEPVVANGLASLFDAVQQQPAAIPRKAHRNGAPPWLAMLLGLAVMGLCLGAALLYWLLRSPAEAILVIQWPEDQRGGDTLTIDGQAIAIPRKGPIERRCSAGQHQLVATRPGYQDAQTIVTASPGERKTVDLAWHKVAQPSLPPTEPRQSQLPPPTLQLPEPGQVLSNVAPASRAKATWDFRWSPVPGASKYHLQVTGPKSERHLIDVDSLPSPQYQHSLPGPIDESACWGWRWRVRAMVDNQWTAWSQEGLFTVEVPGQATRSPVSFSLPKTLSSASWPLRPAVPSVPFPVPTPSAQKHPVPTQAAQSEIRTTLAEEFPELKTPEERLRQARRLVELSKKSRNDPNKRYVLLSEAQQQAMLGGDAGLMLRVIDAIALAYEADVLDLQAQALKQFAPIRGSPARLASLMDHSGEVVDEALAEERFELAADLADEVYAACKSSSKFRKSAHDRRVATRQMVEKWQAVRLALETLKHDPGNADSNLAAGRWYCFDRDDWAKGLSCLVKGSDPLLQVRAQQETTSPPTDALEQLRLADQWWELAGKRRGEEKAGILRRAAHWYRLARSRLTSPADQKAAEKRLDQIAASAPASTEVQIVRLWPEQLQAVPASFAVTVSLSKKPDDRLTVEPKYASTNPLYGTLRLGSGPNRRVTVVIDEASDQPPRVFVDRNNDKDLTNDGPGDWSQITPTHFLLSNLLIDVDYEMFTLPSSFALLRSPASAPQALTCLGIAVRRGEMTSEGRRYQIALIDEDGDASFDRDRSGLVVDLNQDGKMEAGPSSTEYFKLNQPFTVLGKAWEAVWVSPDGTKLKLRPSQSPAQAKVSQLPAFSGPTQPPASSARNPR